MTIIDNSDSQLVKHLPRTVIAKQPKWLNKDRYWNFVFWLGVSCGVSFSWLCEMLHLGTLGTIIFWSTLVTFQLFVIFLNKTTCVEDKQFLNSEGKKICENQLVNPGVVINFLFWCFMAWILSITIIPRYIPNIFTTMISCMALFSLFCLYFIFKNCPISILFNRSFWDNKFWKLKPLATTKSNACQYNHSSPSAATRYSNDVIMNPSYSSLCSNIYHKYR